MLPRLTAQRLSALALAVLALSIYALIVVPTAPLRVCFAIQALACAGFLAKHAMGNRRPS
jgi:hypothetical protein